MRWPDQELNEIQTRDDLARFLRGMAERIRDGSLVVENDRTEAFVEAAGAWTGSMNGFFMNMMEEPVPEQPDWATIAAIFWAALIYE